MTKTIKTLIWTSTGIIVGGTIATGTYFIVELINSNKSKNLGVEGIIEKKLPSENDPGRKFKIIYYPMSNGKQYMTKDEYGKLDDYLTTHLYYGPESDALQEIVFGNRNVINNDSAGLYFPSTRQIFINIEYYKNIITGDIPWQIRMNSVMGVISHEYGHHFAYMYFKNYKPDNSNILTLMTYDGTSFNIWNRIIFNKFKDIFNLNNNDKNSNQFFITTNKGLQLQNVNGTASINQLYEFANSKEHKNPLNVNENYFFGQEHTASPCPTIINTNGQNELKYYYSADEQVARKMELMLYPKGKVTKVNDISFLPNEYINKYNLQNLWSSFAYDMLHTYKLSNTPTQNLIYPDSGFGGTWNIGNGQTLKFANKSNDFYDFLLNTMGYGKQLAYISYNNTGKITSQSSDGNYNYEPPSQNEKKNIKLSGYTDKKFKYLAIANNVTKKIMNNYPLETSFDVNSYTSPFHLFGKKHLLDSYGDNGNIYKNFIKPTQFNYTYIMKNYENINNFYDINNNKNNYSLYFNNEKELKYSEISNTKLDIEKLTTIYDYGGAAQLTNYQGGESTSQKYYRFTLNKNNNLIVSKNY